MKRRTGSDPEITPEDRQLIEAIANDYQPMPMDAVRQAVFRRRLEERLERRARIPWRAAFAGGAMLATAAAVLWLTTLPGESPEAVRVASVPQEEAPLLYAFVDPDDYGGDRLEAQDFLPDDYVALADVLEVPVDDL